MGAKLSEGPGPGLIHPRGLSDGDLAVIETGPYSGTVVQRVEDVLYSVGQSSGQSWGSICTSDNNSKMRVRILKPGELIEVT